MRKLLISGLVTAGLVFSGVSSFAGGTGEETYHEMKQGTSGQSGTTFQESDEMRMIRLNGVTGEVTKVEGDNITVKDKAGVTRSFSITGSQRLGELQAETIKVGDRVYVQFEEQGTQVSIYKIGESGSGKWIKESRLGMKEITGEITNIKDHTLAIKDEIGKTHTIRVADSLETGSRTLKELKVGDDIHIELENGQAVAIHKMKDMENGNY